MKDTPPTEVIDGVTFELRPNVHHPVNPENVNLRKPPRFVQRYKALARQFQGCRMMELGVDQGGGTAFLHKLFKPEALLACELSAEPVERLLAFLSQHDPEQRVHLRWGVDQADRATLRALVGEVFGEQPLDLVVDDASHLFGPTTESFEELFPRLRPRGVFIIEDWGSDHVVERRLAQELENDPSGDVSRALDAIPDGSVRPVPLSQLVCQLVIASTYNPRWVRDVRVFRGFCEVERGPEAIPPGTPIADYIGPMGEWLLPHRTG